MEFLFSHQALMILTLVLILGYASFSDIKTREVEDYVSVMIIVLSIGAMESGALKYCLFGALLTGLPLLVIAICTKGALGGADIKMGIAFGFLLGAEKGLLAIVIGLALGIVIETVIRLIKKKGFKTAFPMVPYLSVGTLIMYVL